MEFIGIQMEIFMTDPGLMEINMEKECFYMQAETGLKVRPVVKAFNDKYSILFLSFNYQFANNSNLNNPRNME